MFGEYLTGEQEEPKRQKVREPYTREELEAVHGKTESAAARKGLRDLARQGKYITVGGSGCNVDYRPNRREVGRKWYRYWSFSEE